MTYEFRYHKCFSLICIIPAVSDITNETTPFNF